MRRAACQADLASLSILESGAARHEFDAPLRLTSA
jgi:hypothetical protein